ncbi:Na+:H+ antiporter NhaD [Abyssogena phaseoliformis symbiont OG214]|uniref:sodium:proton antiporter NhaD n=1 Tax=Abyssogena phaseoliformis symbiont TaxID=596095 RepID=UPI0019161223|nr:sodium:proton antiporter NhaD [Abyssogena phaseoliformis symbiont]MBW5289548.1 Na+/H+ antiporter NhaD type [Candidatus Ruthia sp. Apha_13_S6]BBB22419.1 Na+:H+ antiporter NhaD [Abyssogena phaseoliformis symbiont OG214]
MSAFATNELVTTLDLTSHWVGYTALVLFVLAYILVMVEEFTHFRKSKPVILVAGVIWGLIGWVYTSQGLPHSAEVALRHSILEYSELFLFLLVAMTYIEAIRERQIFEVLKVWLVNKGLTFRQLFWLTGFLAFFISPIADNLTTALIMGAVVLAVGAGNPRFVSIAFINIVVAANAGGAFSPFGDITTLMVWQKGIVEFSQFFSLLVPSLINFIVPAAIMNFSIKNEIATGSQSKVDIKLGGITIVILFITTIITAVSFHKFLHLPPAMGMMTGLSYLMIAAYFIRKSEHKLQQNGFDVFKKVANAEWDTLLFFFGVILSVGGLGFMGYLALTSEAMYLSLGATYANILVGMLSAIVDNIPVMFAVLSMNPDMSLGQWLLVTLTTGVGGSLLSVGSAAGVALMGQSKGLYTFVSHLRWTGVIALGYAASIGAHLLMNGALFDVPV